MPRRTEVETPHMAVPFRLEPGAKAIAVEEQDTLEEIRDCVEVVLRYPAGFRPELPEFGVPDMTFAQITGEDLDASEIEGAVETWEPRAAALVSEAPDEFDATVRRVAIDAQQRGALTS